jgi:disulfide bond formation protein DsbB
MSALFMRQSLKMLNALDLIGISLVMIIAFFMQLYLHELPCPLCLLQRVGLFAIGFGFLLNLHYRPRPAHYMMSLLAAVFTSFVALRQIFLHVVPGTGGYGSTIFGLHMYTWVFIACMVAIIYISIVLSFHQQYAQLFHAEKVEEPNAPWQKALAHIAFFVFFALIIANAFGIFVECGFNECPDNPVVYRL